MAKNKKKMNEAIMWLVAALAIAGVAYGVVFLLTGGSCSKADCSKALWKAGCKKRCGKKEKYLLGNEKQVFVKPHVTRLADGSFEGTFIPANWPNDCGTWLVLQGTNVGEDGHCRRN
jgi:hypothetical protein